MNNLMLEIENINWDKVNGLIPVIIQDHNTLQVLMLGYMNNEALQQTILTKKVTFYSRTKQRLWVKGETSGNELSVISIVADCDNDTLLIHVQPKGPACHLNNRSCFGTENAPGLGILAKLEMLIEQRGRDRPSNSYVAKLFAEGNSRIAQKIGEEGLELALASVLGVKENIKNEAADLLFHLLVLLRQCRMSLMEVLTELHERAT